MASKFLVTDIVDPVKAPITEIGLRHINAMSSEIGDALVKALIGTYTTNDLIILSGCVVTVLSGSVPGTGTASLSAGYVYRNGEVFAVDAIASVATTANTLVWVADDELRDSVQTKFSDGTDYDFLRVAKLKLQAGTSGTGLNDFDATTVKLKRQSLRLNIGDWDMDTNSLVTIAHGLGTLSRKITKITGQIRNDADTQSYQLGWRDSGGLISLNSSFDGTNIYLYRDSTDFDTTDFNSTSYNRGYIFVEYGDI